MHLPSSVCDPDVIPDTRNGSSSRNSTIIGSIEITPAAINADQSIPCSPMKDTIPVVIVQCAWSLISVFANTKSDHDRMAR